MFLTVLGPGYKNASVQFRNIDRGLLEQPKNESDKEHKVNLGSVLFGCCSKMHVTVAVRAFQSATEEEVNRKARVKSNLKHPSFPLLQRIVKALSFSHIIL